MAQQPIDLYKAYLEGSKLRLGYGGIITIVKVHSSKFTYPFEGSDGEFYTKEGLFSIDEERKYRNVIEVLENNFNKVIDGFFTPIKTNYFGIPLFLPPWCNFIAMDKNGTVEAYQFSPVLDLKRNCWDEGIGMSYGIGVLDTKKIDIDWKKSVIRITEVERVTFN